MKEVKVLTCTVPNRIVNEMANLFIHFAFLMNAENSQPFVLMRMNPLTCHGGMVPPPGTLGDNSVINNILEHILMGTYSVCQMALLLPLG